MATSTSYVREESNVPFVIRVLWFFLIGWHVTLYWIVAAWLLNLTIIGMPLGLWMLNRVPLVLTLRPPRGYSVAQVRDGRVVEWRHQGVPQHFFLIRLIYFLLIGWWFSLLWSLLGWLLCVSIIGLPFGVWMLNRLPNVTTLMRQ
ncbi:MAG: YccF domain-containing protein [Chloroflexi bacterium]|nr:YccF domain-containing protein [Chloroflexota bacterium]